MILFIICFWLIFSKRLCRFLASFGSRVFHLFGIIRIYFVNFLKWQSYGAIFLSSSFLLKFALLSLLLLLLWLNDLLFWLTLADVFVVDNDECAVKPNSYIFGAVYVPCTYVRCYLENTKCCEVQCVNANGLNDEKSSISGKHVFANSNANNRGSDLHVKEWSERSNSETHAFVSTEFACVIWFRYVSKSNHTCRK